MKTVAIIQARMGSSRFPGKMLSLLDTQPLISWIVQRTRAAKRVDEVVVATTTCDTDLPLVQWCEKHDVGCFRGSVDDVLARFFHTAAQFDADRIVRLTGDCPLLDPQLIDDVVECLEYDRDVDFATNCEPMTFPEGMSAECFPRRILQKMHREARLPSHREHVTPYVRFAPSRFRHAIVTAEPNLAHLRLAVDYEADLQALEDLVHEIRTYIDPAQASLNDVLRALYQRADIRRRLADKQRDLWRQEVAQDEQRRIA